MNSLDFDLPDRRTSSQRPRQSEGVSNFVLACILIAMVSFIAGRVVEASVEGQYSASSVQTLSGQQ